MRNSHSISVEKCHNELSFLFVARSEARLEVALEPEGNLRQRKNPNPDPKQTTTPLCDGSYLSKAHIMPHHLHSLLL